MRTKKKNFIGLDFDDFMGETITDSRGYFEVSGSNAEVSPIDPKINIYHDCEDGWWVSIVLFFLQLKLFSIQFFLLWLIKIKNKLKKQNEWK